MSVVLYVSTIILNFAGVLFSTAYIWLNAFSKVSDLSSRNSSVLKIIRVSMVLSIVFAFLFCLLADSGSVEDAIDSAAVLFSIIAISWLVVLLGCGLVLFISFISKTRFKKELVVSFKKLFSTAVTGAVLGMILSWLLY